MGAMVYVFICSYSLINLYYIDDHIFLLCLTSVNFSWISAFSSAERPFVNLFIDIFVDLFYCCCFCVQLKNRRCLFFFLVFVLSEDQRISSNQFQFLRRVIPNSFCINFYQLFFPLSLSPDISLCDVSIFCFLYYFACILFVVQKLHNRR